MKRLPAIVIVSGLLVASVAAQQDSHAKMNARGAAAMGFDQDKTTHHFLLYEDGGAIDISVNDAADAKNRDAIRAHLPHLAMMLGDGVFDVPMFVHEDKTVPGAKVLSEKKAAVKYAYVETPRGARVDIVTTDREALAALHEFLKFQIAEHRTGDPVTPRKR